MSRLKSGYWSFDYAKNFNLHIKQMPSYKIQI